MSTDNGTQDDLEPKINRALPQIYIDLLLDGPPSGEAAPMANIYSRLVSVAMSAYRRGWTEAQFLDEVTARSRVGSGGRRRWRERRLWVLLKSHRNSEAAAIKTLQKAWSSAVANLNDIGERSKRDVRDDAIERPGRRRSQPRSAGAAAWRARWTPSAWSSRPRRISVNSLCW